MFRNELDSDKEVISNYSVNLPNVYGFGHQAYYEDVVDCLQNQSPALMDCFQSRKSLELIPALYESTETGREVALLFSPRHCRLGAMP